MDPELAPCLGCAEAVPNEATRCPRCGYDLARHDRSRRRLGALGTVLCLSVVLAPVGAPLLWLAYRHRLAAGGTVTTRPEPSLGAQLRTVIGYHLGFKPPEGPGRSGYPTRRDGIEASQR